MNGKTNLISKKRINMRKIGKKMKIKIKNKINLWRETHQSKDDNENDENKKENFTLTSLFLCLFQSAFFFFPLKRKNAC